MKRVFSICLLAFLPLLAWAIRDDENVSRSVKRSFSVNREVHLEISNKYGQLVISPWEKDSVSFRIEMIAYGKTRSDARKILERAEIDFDQSSTFLTAETIFDRNSNVFVEFWNSLTDEASALLSKSKIEVNYEVFVPEGIVISLVNRYGDVYLHELNNRINLDVMHGNIRGNNINETVNIDLAFGDIRLKSIQDGRITLKAAEGDIIKAGNISLNSSSSDLVIREAGQVRIDSRSDKRLRFEKVGSIYGDGMFSNISIGELVESLELDLSYGDLRIYKVPFNFQTIDITARSTDVEINLQAGSYIDVMLEGKEQDIHVPFAFEGLDRRVTDDRKGMIRLDGKVGNRNNYPATLHIRSEGGEIMIDQSELDEPNANRPDKR